jgi:hypothetical protein
VSASESAIPAPTAGYYPAFVAFAPLPEDRAALVLDGAFLLATGFSLSMLLRSASMRLTTFVGRGASGATIGLPASFDFSLSSFGEGYAGLWL